ncbi:MULTISPECIES: hypothetical protein [Nocardiaceae]|nr:MULTISPECIES: hypothetical protein [Rhodococcus]
MVTSSSGVRGPGEGGGVGVGDRPLKIGRAMYHPGQDTAKWVRTKAMG